MHAGATGREEREVKEELKYRIRGHDKPWIVLDTNVFIAAYWNKNSASAEILRAVLEDRLLLFYTQQIRKEIFHILDNIRARESYRREVESILERGMAIQTPGRLHIVAEDPEDDKFIECAVYAQADYLIANDHHILQFKVYEDTEIVKPSDFLRILRAI